MIGDRYPGYNLSTKVDARLQLISNGGFEFAKVTWQEGNS